MAIFFTAASATDRDAVIAVRRQEIVDKVSSAVFENLLKTAENRSKHITESIDIYRVVPQDFDNLTEKSEIEYRSHGLDVLGVEEVSWTFKATAAELVEKRIDQAFLHQIHELLKAHFTAEEAQLAA